MVITSGITSIVNASFEMANRLEKDGHSIIYASRSGIEDAVMAQGLKFVQLDQPTRHPGRSDRSPDPATTLGTHRFVDQITPHQPELFIIDIELSEYVAATIATSTPVMLMSTFLSLWKRPGLPPLHTTLAPGKGLTGCAICLEVAWAYFRTRKWLSRTIAKARGRSTDKTSLLRRLAKDYGYDFDQYIDFNQWLIPFFYRRLPVLNLNALEFDFPHQPHPLCHFVGPMIAIKRNETFLPESTGQCIELNRLLAQFQSRERVARPLIYCAFGRFSISYDKGFLTRIIDVFQKHPEWELILSLGGHLAREKLPDVPENVHAFEWLPQLEVLPVVDCAIIHAGISTINECIYYGIPW